MIFMFDIINYNNNIKYKLLFIGFPPDYLTSDEDALWIYWSNLWN